MPLTALALFCLIALPPLVLAAPDINTKTKNATFPLNNDNSARPGDTINYNISVGNNGAPGTTDALNVQVADTIDPNSTFVSNSAKVSANAIAHVYNAAGNTQLIVNAASGLKIGVVDLDGVTPNASLVVTAGTFPTSAGGSVTIAADGSFTYTPQTGDQNLNDTFSYTVTDGDALPSTGLVTINLGARVWYVDSTYAGANGPEDGSNLKPFNTLSDVSGGAGPDAAGDIIFVVERAGDYDGGITLLATQQLYGSGFTLVVNTITINTAGANTTMVTTAASTNAITLASGNTVKGFTIGNTTSYKIANTITATVGALTISNVTMTGNGGLFRADSGGALTVTIDSASTSAFTGIGIQLVNTTGTFTINGSGTITGVTGDDVQVNGGTATVSIASTITNAAGRSVNVQNKTAGSVSFGGAITDNAGSTGISLTTNTGATINFNGNLTLTTTTNAAFTATGGGTLTAPGTNVITTTTGSAVVISGMTGNLTFQKITVAGATKGISVNGLTGSFAVTGTTNDLISGGTITGGASTTRGSEFINVTGGVSLAHMTFTNAAQVDGGSATTCGTDLINNDNTACSAPIHMATVGTAVTLNMISVNGSSQTGINGFDLRNLAMTSVSVTGAGNAVNEHGVVLKNLRGTNTITNSSFSSNRSRQLYVINTIDDSPNATPTLSITASTFSNSTDLQGALFDSYNAGNIIVNVGDDTVAGSNTFSNNFSNALQQSVGLGGDMTINIKRNTINHKVSGIVLQAAGVGTTSNLNYTIWNNTVVKTDLQTNNGSGAIIVSGTQQHQINGDIRSNTIGNGTPGSGSFCGGGCNGITVDHNDISAAGGGRHNVTIVGNTVRNVDSSGIRAVIGQKSKGNIVITGNLIRDPDNAPAQTFSAIYVQGGIVAADPSCIAATIGGTTNPGTWPSTAANAMNQIIGGWDPSGFQSEIFIWRKGGTFNIPGLVGSTNADVVTFVTARNNISDATGADVTATGGPFGNGVSCPLMLAAGGISSAQDRPLWVSAGVKSGASTNSTVAPADNTVTSIAAPRSTVANADATAAVNPDRAQHSGIASSLSQEQLDEIVASAIARWVATGLTENQLAALRGLKFEVADLPSIYLGEADGSRIRVAKSAGGNGWFVEAHPRSDGLFAHNASTTRGYTDEASAPAGRIDLLTTIMHEMGHAIGLPDSYSERDRDSLMYGFLTKGERRVPQKGQAAGAIPGSVTGSHFLNLPVTIGTLNPGTTVTVTFQATVNASGFCGNITNTANISGSNFVTVNTNTTSVPVHFPPSLFSAQTPPATGTKDFAYAGYTFVANGCPAPTYALAPGSPTLPPGLTLAANGALTGTPTTAGTYSNIIVRATNSAGTFDTAPFTITIAPPITFNTNSPLDPWTKDHPGYSETISTSGGTGAITYSVSAGALPNGLSLNANSGEISGTPTVAGTFNFTILATDSLGASTSKAYQIVINAAITVSPATLPNGQVGVAYSQLVMASGGTGTKTFSVSAGTLPSGLMLNTATGEISGTPDTPGSYGFTITATDTVSATGSQAYTVVIKQATTTNLISSQNPASNGAAVTFTATVDEVGAPAGTPTGTVTFFDGASPITCTEGGTAQALNGSSQATCTTSSLTVAGSPHSITAQYSGDANYLASTSNTVSQTIIACTTPITVTTLNDAGAGSLRQALLDVCDGGTINFQAGLTGTITLTTGQLEIAKNVTITGPGSVFSVVLTVSGGDSSRVFNVQSNKTVAISGLGIADGSVSSNANQGGRGGGVYVNTNASLTLSNCVISDNHTSATGTDGGAIYNAGTLILTSDSFHSNSAVGTGGALRNGGNLTVTNSSLFNNSSTGTIGGGAIFNTGTMAIYGSTLSNNTAAKDGGAILSDAAGNTVTITNSTLSGNQATGATGDGGALSNVETVTLTNVTITNNSAGRDGGGIHNIGTVNVKNSIVASNTATGSAPDLKGNANVNHSLLGDSTGAGTITGANNLSGDPKIGPLANNGGPTNTHVPKADSPVIDAGDNAAVTNPPFAGPPFTDQRLLVRIVDGNHDTTATVDMGAVEVNYAIAVTAGDGQSTIVETAFPTNLKVTASESGIPISGATVTFTAPGSGPSGTFADTGTNVSNAIATNGSGEATAPVFTANSNAGGPYNVVASATGYSSATFQLTNTPAPPSPTPTATATATATATSTPTATATATATSTPTATATSTPTATATSTPTSTPTATATSTPTATATATATASPTPTSTATATPTATATATATATPTSTPTATATSTPTATATSTPTATATATPTSTPTATPTATPSATATATATASATAAPSATATATASATAAPSATATASATATPAATATATPTATPTGSPTATPAQALNISTRLRVDVGDKVMIAGFIITGNVPKPVVLRGLGPSLVGSGIPAASVLNDPLIELHASNGSLITSNDNWKDSPQKALFEGTVFQPTDDREAVILATLPPAAYTLIIKGVGNTTGIGLIEVYDNDAALDADLANISTRGFVQTGNEVMIGGFVLGGNSNPTRIAVRALGPSLAGFGLSNVLADPTLELHNENGTIMVSNDDWLSDPISAANLVTHGLGLPNAKESGIFTALAPPGQFTAIVAGKNGGIGIALVEIYNLK